MKLEQVKKLSPLDRYVYWIKERDSIRAKRALKLPKPWTDDEILQQYRFCNVVRMDDKVSQWLLKNWYQPHRNHPNMLGACAIARHYNLPEALSEITEHVFDHWDLMAAAVVLRERKAKGLNIFNGAYMVRGIGEVDKTEMVMFKVVGPLVAANPKINDDSMQESVEALLPYWGFSLFMAGQVIADLRWALTGRWKDRKQWAPMGPGSQRGMNRLLDLDIKKPMKQEQFLEHLQTLIKDCTPLIPHELSSRMEAIDWQSCFCEYDKYTRVLFGEGRPKQKYPGV